jgi:hypothetical protein
VPERDESRMNTGAFRLRRVCIAVHRRVRKDGSNGHQNGHQNFALFLVQPQSGPRLRQLHGCVNHVQGLRWRIFIMRGSQN